MATASFRQHVSFVKPSCELHSIKLRPPCLFLVNSRWAAIRASQIEEACTQVATSEHFWKWNGYNIRYQTAGGSGPALVLIHGFGANSDHWRKNLAVLAQSNRVYAIDLLGYGFSDKPSPRNLPPNSLYNFDTWAKQVLDFCTDIIRDRAFLICNSIGGIVGLQAALTTPQLVQGVQLLNVSLRLLHIKKQAWYIQPFVKSLQSLLRNTEIGRIFFQSVASQNAVRNILRQCYYDEAAVTDELIEKILLPGLQQGAADVFLDFISYSGGPLPEEMLSEVQCPVSILWGEKDPWEPLALGSRLANFTAVEEFIVVPNAGHCPQVSLQINFNVLKSSYVLILDWFANSQDEVPNLVNELIEKFVARHSGN